MSTQNTPGRRLGMGIVPLWDPADYSAADYPAGPPISSPPFNPSENGNDGGSWWDTWGGPILLGAEKALSNIFAPAATSIAQSQPALGYQYQGGQTPYRNPSQGVGFGVDSQGIRLSEGSHISWPVIALVVGGFVLIQSRPFSRR